MNKRFWRKNGSTILTVLGGVGVVTTAVFTAKATLKVHDILEQAEEKKGEELTKWEKVQTVTPAYVPAILTGVGAITCIFGANHLNKRQQAALVSAYALLDQSYKEYKKKVTELYGETTDKIIKTEIASDHYEEDKDEIEDLEEDDGKSLFYDYYSQRYFRATNEQVLKAEYDINRQVSAEYNPMSLNDYYKMVGLDPIEYGDRFGWESGQMCEHYWSDWVYFKHTKMDLEDGMECYMIDFTDPLMFD